MWPCKTNTSSWSEVQWLYGKTVPNQNVIATANTHSIHHPNASAILAIVRKPSPATLEALNLLEVLCRAC